MHILLEMCLLLQNLWLICNIKERSISILHKYILGIFIVIEANHRLHVVEKYKMGAYVICHSVHLQLKLLQLRAYPIILRLHPSSSLPCVVLGIRHLVLSHRVKKGYGQEMPTVVLLSEVAHYSRI